MNHGMTCQRREYLCPTPSKRRHLLGLHSMISDRFQFHRTKRVGSLIGRYDLLDRWTVCCLLHYPPPSDALMLCNLALEIRYDDESDSNAGCTTSCRVSRETLRR
ncbi:hypothetical protein PMIN03_012849 [Paraphaeosphaeria minitans]